MTTTHEARRLRQELATQDRGRGRRYDDEVRARVVAFAELRRAEGWSWMAIATELGVRFETLRRWCRGVPRVVLPRICGHLMRPAVSWPEVFMAAAKKKRRHFTPEYKAEVVALVLKGGKTANAVARDLGLTATAVREWVKRATGEEGSGSGELTMSEREELAALKREVKTLRLERDILKKATAFFAKETT